jgi:predicted phosphoadenosine phosphosulfate sulfurtransferase
VTESPESAAARRLPGRLRALPRRPYGTDVWTAGLERTAELMSAFDKVIVAFSGGKDSTAALQVALEVAHSDPKFERHLPLRAVFWDEEAIPYETEQYVRRVTQRGDVALEWMCVPVQHRNACSRKHPYWWPWAPEAEDLWCRPLPPEAIQTIPGFKLWPQEARYTIPVANGLLCNPEDGNTAMILGIRAAESLVRNAAVSSKTVDNWIVPYTGETTRGGVWKAYPVYDWSDQDVWTAPAKFGWDYNRAYDLQELAGRSARQQRCSPAFGEEPLQQLHVWATAFPDVWDKMVDRVPGVGAAYRYALTELWGNGSRPEKPDWCTWPQFVEYYLHKFDPPVTRRVAARLAGFIKMHYRKTAHPILPHGRHPETGLDWDFILRVAMRGDFKERNQPNQRSSLDGQGRRPVGDWKRYAAELQRCLDAGVTPEDIGWPLPRLPQDPWALLPDYAREELGCAR